jgi:deoxyinosine 3'endonuclease (endonuclease V)
LKKQKIQIHSHKWDLSPQEASALQSELARQVVREMQLGGMATVAGIDVGIHAGVSSAFGKDR